MSLNTNMSLNITQIWFWQNLWLEKSKQKHHIKRNIWNEIPRSLYLPLSIANANLHDEQFSLKIKPSKCRSYVTFHVVWMKAKDVFFAKIDTTFEHIKTLIHVIRYVIDANIKRIHFPIGSNGFFFYLIIKESIFFLSALNHNHIQTEIVANLRWDLMYYSLKSVYLIFMLKGKTTKQKIRKTKWKKSLNRKSSRSNA